MKKESNITLYYENFIDSLAETAKLWMKDQENADQEYGYDYDENNAVDRAINDQFIYHVDRAYVLAYAYTEGHIDWSGEINWQAINEMVWNNTYNELKNKLNEE